MVGISGTRVMNNPIKIGSTTSRNFSTPSPTARGQHPAPLPAGSKPQQRLQPPPTFDVLHQGRDPLAPELLQRGVDAVLQHVQQAQGSRPPAVSCIGLGGYDLGGFGENKASVQRG